MQLNSLKFKQFYDLTTQLIGPLTKSWILERLGHSTNQLFNQTLVVVLENKGFYGNRKYLTGHQGFSDIDPITLFQI